MTYNEFTIIRDKLHRYFAHRSVLDAIAIHPISRDERTTGLVRRLYEEESASRYFHVCPRTASDGTLDAFFKKTGLEFDITLLVISIGLEERDFPIVWDCYLKWMHQSADEGTLLELIRKH